MSARPVIAITADHLLIRDVLPGAAVYQVYSDAVIHGADALPWLLPPAGADLDTEALLERIDGIVFTGARSNVEPWRYQGAPAPADSPRDPARDDTTLPLLPRVIERGIPMLCICRGMQELNVALGGDLHQDLSQLPGALGHLAPEEQPVGQRFALSHEIRIEPGGVLEQLAPTRTVMVNSVHQQGIARLADDLLAEARAPDGVIEAVRVKNSPAFACGVQWHPEWDWREHDLNANLWRAFSKACYERRAVGRDAAPGRTQKAPGAAHGATQDTAPDAVRGAGR